MIFRFISKILYTVLVAIETLISLRFVFKLIGASTTSSIVSSIYEWSNYFVSPFEDIVDAEWYLGNFFIEVDSLVALFVFMILAYVAAEMIKVFSSHSNE